MVGSYELVRCLDTVGTGAVYLGQHPEILSRVAIKVLAPELSAETDVVKRFLDEARAQNRIGHPGIVPINDCDAQDDVGLFLVMEYVEGKTLAEEFKESGQLSAQRTADVARQAASALGAAHAAGIVHRKLKPSNIIMTPDPDLPAGERVRIFGFGIAKLVEESETLDEATKTGIALGFPRYISPEQCLDAKGVDHRTDVYSLGAICYEMLCGRPPYEAETFGHMVIRQETTEPPAPSSLVELPTALEEVVVRAIHKDPEQRFSDMKALRAALDAAVPQGRARPAPPRTSRRPPKPRAEEPPEATATAMLRPGGSVKKAAPAPLSDERKTAILDTGEDADRETVILEESPGSLHDQDTVIQSSAPQHDSSLADEETLIQADGEETVVERGAVDPEETLIQPETADEPETLIETPLADQETMIKGAASLADQETMIKGGGLAAEEILIKQAPRRDTGAIPAVEVKERRSHAGLVWVLVLLALVGLGAAWFLASKTSSGPQPAAAPAPPRAVPAPPPAPPSPAPPAAPKAEVNRATETPGQALPPGLSPAAPPPDSATLPDASAAPEAAPATPTPKKKQKKRRRKKKPGKKGPYFRDL